MSSDHSLFRFSATCRTDDPAVLRCLRSLCQFAEEHRMPQIGWGGTGTSEWQKKSGSVTFRFTDPRFRELFLSEGERLLAGHWKLVGTSDNDPASPQR
jgi:hypothetical protein